MNGVRTGEVEVRDEKDKQRNIREWSLTQWWREKEWNISDRQKMLTSAKNQTPTSTGTGSFILP